MMCVNKDSASAFFKHVFFLILLKELGYLQHLGSLFYKFLLRPFSSCDSRLHFSSYQFDVLFLHSTKINFNLFFVKLSGIFNLLFR